MKRKHEEALQLARVALKAAGLEQVLEPSERLVIGGHRESDQWVFNVAARRRDLKSNDLSIDAADTSARPLAIVRIEDASATGKVVKVSAS